MNCVTLEAKQIILKMIRLIPFDQLKILQLSEAPPAKSANKSRAHADVAKGY